MSTAIETKEIVWKPNAGPQTWVLQKIEDEIFFGGQRGGGKTDAGIVWMVEPVENKLYAGLVLRKNHKDLSDWISRAKRLYANVGGVYVGDTFRFPSGATIKTGHLAEEDAYEKYQGHEYQRILIEELTHIPTEELFLKVLGSNRSTVPDLRAQFMGTANPGGPGHRWVKKRYIDTAVLYDREYIDDEGLPQTCKHGRRWTDPVHQLTRIYVPSRVEDNPFLFKLDPKYVRYLDSLPEELKKAWRLGDWNTYEIKGAYYANEIAMARKHGRITNVPHDPAALVHTWWDLGNSENTPILFMQQVGLEWHLIDFHIGGSGGIKYYVKVLKDRAELYGYNYGKHWAPHDIKAKEFTTGMTRWDTAKALGVTFNLVPKYSVEDGRDAVRIMFDKLWMDQTRCEYAIDAFANYHRKYNQTLAQFEDDHVDDWAAHPSDALRYWAVTNMPMEDKQSELSRRKQQEANQEQFDPYSLLR